MAYNQDSSYQRYPHNQYHNQHQQIQRENSYSPANGASANGGRQPGAPYGGPEHLPQSQDNYHHAYPNDRFYRSEIQFEGYQASRGGHNTSNDANGQGGGYGDGGNGIGQAVMGNYQPAANPSYAPDTPPQPTNWDNPFPPLPGPKNKARNIGSIDDPTLDGVAPGKGAPNGSSSVPNDGRPQTAGSKGSQRSMRSHGQSQNGQRMLGSQGENQNQEFSRTQMPMAESVGLSGQGGQGREQHDYGGEQHNVAGPLDSGHRYPGQASWQELGPTAGYYGPMGRDFVSRGTAPPTGGELYSEKQTQIEDNREPHYDHKRQESFGDVLDAYFDSEGDGPVQDSSYAQELPSKQELDVHHSQPSSVFLQSIEDDMPNFDAQPSQLSKHKRGMSIENHLPGPGKALHPENSDSFRQNAVQPTEPQQPRDFAAQVHRSRSQPDFRSRDQRTMTTDTGGGAFEVAGDVPSTPAVPQQYAEQQYQVNRYGYQNAPPGNYGQPRGRGAPRFAEKQGPVRSQTLNDGQYYQQRPPGPQQRPPGPYQQLPPGPSQRPPPDFRQQYPPGPRPPIRPGSRPQMPPGSRQQLPLRQRTNPGMTPAGPTPSPHLPPNSGMPNTGPPPGRQPSSSNRFGSPDTLPQHPTPVRPGLMPGSALRQASPPPPVRQYGNAGVTAKQGSPPNSASQMNGVGNRRSSIPVTHEELEQLKRAVEASPGDQSAQLLLAKKWIEAAAVLVDDGGVADMKTRNKARERFIFDAHKLIKKLVGANYTEAMFYLADCYGRGLLGLEPDQKEAFNLYQSAAKLGHASSAYRTAVCCEMGHEDGGGTKRDPLKAIQWYKRAATLGDTPAMYKMGIILLKGLLGQQKNPREAVVWLKRAAERADEENPHALHELGLLYENAGSNDSIIRDENYACQLFTQAADLGYKFSQFRLGCAFEYGSLGYPIDPRQSIIWYSHAAVQGERQSELALSGWYLTGSEGILQQSDTEAYLWARKAAQAGLAKAEYALGYFTEVGIGTPSNLEDAKRWYWRAAAQNFPRARERLEELKSGGSKVQKSRERHSRSNMTKQNEGDCVVM